MLTKQAMTMKWRQRVLEKVYFLRSTISISYLIKVQVLTVIHIFVELNHSGLGMLGRSFGQAWHWFKEQRRAASVGLNTRLTYVTLPWHRIIADVLDNRRTPALTF